MKIKKGVRVFGLRPEMVLAAQIAESVYLAYGVELVITAAIDGKHKSYSAHNIGNAIDTRTRDLKPDQIPSVAKDLRHALSEDFDVVVEKTHIHIEFDPQTGYTA